MKRLVALLMAILMIAMVGCNGGGEESKTETSKTETSKTETSKTETSKTEEETSLFNEPGTLPIVKDGTMTLTIFAPGNGELSWADNDQVKWLEENTGIVLDWTIAASSDNVRDKISTMFAGGDMTDIILTGVGGANRYDKASEAMFGAQGLIIPVEEYIDTISVGYKAAFEAMDGMRDYITTPDGHIYSLPNVDASLHVQYNMKLWINTEWIENLGMEIPTTTDEFYAVMKAFKEKDANGNGDPNDEIPLSTVTSGSGTQIDGFLMAPFQLTPENNKLYVDNGVVTYAPVQEGYKEGLTWLAQMYAEGLITPESFTWDKNSQVNLNESGDVAVIGAFLAQRPGYACDLSTYPGNSKKWEQYQSLDPLTGPDGQCIAAWNPYVQYQTGMTFISSSCENPEAAFRFIDYLATTEGSTFSAIGIEGEEWRAAEAGEFDMDGEQADYTMIPGDSKENHTLGQLMGLVRLPDFITSVTTNQDPYADDVAPLTGRQIVMYRASKQHELVKQPLESVMPDLYMSEEDTAEMALIKATLDSTQKEWLAAFVTGEKSVEADWDAYLAALEAQSLSRYVELLQTAYDASVFSK
jgi:putative aldouronate transport system substrate-binding protein